MRVQVRARRQGRPGGHRPPRALLRRLSHAACPVSYTHLQTLFISHGDSEEDARLVAEMIKERTGLELQVLNFVGPVIGSHSGPGTIAVFFIGSER